MPDPPDEPDPREESLDPEEPDDDLEESEPEEPESEDPEESELVGPPEGPLTPRRYSCQIHPVLPPVRT